MASARFESSKEVGEQEDYEVDLDQIQVCKKILTTRSRSKLAILEGAREIEL